MTLGGHAWEATLAAVLDGVRDELGLPPTTKLRAELHAMLVYGKGQFFLPHQDSEKDDAMVGTLVVTLPSATRRGTGRRALRRERHVPGVEGASVLRRVLRRLPSRGQARQVRVPSDTDAQPARGRRDRHAGSRADRRLGALPHGAFHHARRAHYGRADLDPPNRLVYLLDHEYTQRGLSWNRLKGADAERAALMRAAAERAGCEAVLALAEVNETWDAGRPTATRGTATTITASTATRRRTDDPGTGTATTMTTSSMT